MKRRHIKYEHMYGDVEETRDMRSPRSNDTRLREICKPEDLDDYQWATSGIDPNEPSIEQLVNLIP
jgi:hypothetical protein